MTSVVAILCQYSIDIMEAVCSPLSGLPARLKWLPALSEVRDACQEIQGERDRLAQMTSAWDDGVRKQLAERDAFEKAQKKNLTYQELRAKYDGPNGEPWGISAGKYSRVSSREQAGAALVSKVGQEAFDAIPNNPAADYRRPE